MRIAGATPLGTEWGPVLLRRRDGEPTGKMPVAVMAESSFSFRKLLDQCENQELEVAVRLAGSRGLRRPRSPGQRGLGPAGLGAGAGRAQELA